MHCVIMADFKFIGIQNGHSGAPLYQLRNFGRSGRLGWATVLCSNKSVSSSFIAFELENNKTITVVCSIHHSLSYH